MFYSIIHAYTFNIFFHTAIYVTYTYTHTYANRSTSVPAKATLEPVVVLSKPDAKSLATVGFASSVTCLIVHDGKTSFFDTMPAHVKKQFKGHQHMREHMGLDKNGSHKVIALVLNSYTSKGPNNYDISDRKIRAGYGTATISLTPRDTQAKNIQNLFGTQKPKLEDADVVQHPMPEPEPSISASNHARAPSDEAADPLQTAASHGSVEPVESVESTVGPAETFTEAVESVETEKQTTSPLEQSDTKPTVDSLEDHNQDQDPLNQQPERHDSVPCVEEHVS